MHSSNLISTCSTNFGIFLKNDEWLFGQEAFSIFFSNETSFEIDKTAQLQILKY